jgi:hypothetical protein
MNALQNERACEKNITNISFRASTLAKLSGVIFAGGKRRIFNFLESAPIKAFASL